MNNQIYYEDFACLEDVLNNYSIAPEVLEGCEIIYATYTYENYDGGSHVIFLKDGKVYEVNGSHCSCYGLEGQWEPEETSVVALLSRPNVDEAAKAILKERYKNLLCFL